MTAGAADHRLTELRDALGRHQVVALIGARGTGKTALRDALIAHYARSSVRTVVMDALGAREMAELNLPLADVLRCHSSELSIENLGVNDVVRVFVDNCHEFYDRPWFPMLQEQWRALLSTEAARGRVAMLLLGRPLFRQVAGGDGSPLLNLGPTLVVSPLSASEIADEMGVDERCAAAVRRKTGGHPKLTKTLVSVIEGDVSNLGPALGAYVAEQERYLIRLAEDHSMAALGLLADVISAAGPVAEPALVSAHFGRAFAEGQEALADLEGSGLILRRDGMCALAAELLRHAPGVRGFIRAPVAVIPTDAADQHAAAAQLVYVAENRLRERIVDSLGGVDRAWWPSRIPAGFVGDAENRRRAELESNAASEREAHPIMFLSFGELMDIVLERENWRQVFSIALRRSSGMVRGAAQDLGAVRNKVAHNRPVSSADMALALAAIERLGLRL